MPCTFVNLCILGIKQFIGPQTFMFRVFYLGTEWNVGDKCGKYFSTSVRPKKNCFLQRRAGGHNKSPCRLIVWPKHSVKDWAGGAAEAEDIDWFLKAGAIRLDMEMRDSIKMKRAKSQNRTGQVKTEQAQNRSRLERTGRSRNSEERLCSNDNHLC